LMNCSPRRLPSDTGMLPAAAAAAAAAAGNMSGDMLLQCV
jgi:hypothetical protein